MSNIGFRHENCYRICKECFLLVRKSGILATKAQKNYKKKTTLDNLPSALDNLPSTLDNIPSTLDILPSTLDKNLHSKSTYFLKLTHQERVMEVKWFLKDTIS